MHALHFLRVSNLTPNDDIYNGDLKGREFQKRQQSGIGQLGIQKVLRPLKMAITADMVT